MKATTQITTAETFGMISYEQGNRIPAADKDLMRMLEGRTPGNTPEGQASTKELLQAWNKGNNIAHKLYMKQKFGF